MKLTDGIGKKKLLAIGIGITILIATVVGFIQLYFREMEFSSEGLVFAAVGDPHYGWTGDQNADDITNAWTSDPNLPPPDFAINIGDYTHFGTSEGYQVATKDSFGDYLMPWMFVFGNHDTADYKTDTGRDIYNDGSGVQDTEVYDIPYQAIESGKEFTGTMQRNYAYLWDNILFLVFGDMGNTMLLTHSQRQWLNYMTDLYPNKTTITISHQGFHPQAGHSTYRYYNDLTWWESFIQDNPQLALHIHGHNHEFLHYTYHGLDAVDTGITNEMGKPYTVYFEITESSISAGIYNVAKKRWQNGNFFRKELETGWKDEGISWYSVSKRVQDAQNFEQDNRILAKNHKVQLIGSDPELVEQNRKFDHWGNPENSLYWIGYDNDGDNGKTEGYVEFNGTDSFSASTTPAFDNQIPLGWYTKWTEGKVPDSTTPRAIPGKTYKVKAKVRADKEIQNAMDISLKVLGKNLSQTIKEKTSVISAIDLNSNYKWVEGEILVPEDQDSWILKTIWDSKDSTGHCYLDEWSIMRKGAQESTADFNLTLNDHHFSHLGVLGINEFAEFNVPHHAIQNQLNFSPSMGGSKTGLIRLIYEDPILWSDDLSVGFEPDSGQEEYICQFQKVYPQDLQVPLSVSLFNQNYTIENAVLHDIKGYKAYTLSQDMLAGSISVGV